MQEARNLPSRLHLDLTTPLSKSLRIGETSLAATMTGGEVTPSLQLPWLLPLTEIKGHHRHPHHRAVISISRPGLIPHRLHPIHHPHPLTGIASTPETMIETGTTATETITPVTVTTGKTQWRRLPRPQPRLL